MITRAYFWVPIGYAVGAGFDSWEEAYAYAEERLLKPTAGLSQNISLRWVLKEPDGPEVDIIVETYPVMRRG